jgi:hypothetical protein
MLASEPLDSGTATIIAATVGAGAALIATFITLAVTRWLDDRRWVREREHRDLVDSRAAYAKMRRTGVAWREATVDLIGKPTTKEWEVYWAARQDAMEAAAELEMIGSPLALETISEALEQLLDVWWDYENNGPWAVESGPLWSRMRYVDARLDAFRDLARAEFGLEPEVEDPRSWLETPELVRRRAAELGTGRRKGAPPPESEAEAAARREFEERRYRAARAGTARRLEWRHGMSKAAAEALIDAWEAEAVTRKIRRESEVYWRQADEWLSERIPPAVPESQAPRSREGPPRASTSERSPRRAAKGPGSLTGTQRTQTRNRGGG